MEITANALQTVQPNLNVQFTDTAIAGNFYILHRDNSGLVNIKGITNQCRARYRICFGANIAVPTGETVGPIQLSLSLDGESLGSATAIVTPTAVEDFFNVFTATFIEIPKGCCMTVSVRNTSTIPIDVQNANMIVERVA